MDRIIKITKEMAQERLGDVPPEKQFWCCDGRILKDLPELGVALEEMAEETFYYHCNEAKSDFSNWVRDVIGDEKLSRDLRKSSTRHQAMRSVASRIAWLRTKMASD